MLGIPFVSDCFKLVQHATGVQFGLIQVIANLDDRFEIRVPKGLVGLIGLLREQHPYAEREDDKYIIFSWVVVLGLQEFFQEACTLEGLLLLPESTKGELWYYERSEDFALPVS